MSFLLKFKQDEKPPVDEVARALYDALETEGFDVRESDISERRDINDVYAVLGVVHLGNDYDVMYLDKRFTKQEVQTKTLFDQFGIDHIDAIVKFSRTGMDFCEGMIPPVAEFAFEPNKDKVDFLRLVGEGLKQKLPTLDLAILAYQPDRKEHYVYEKLE
jgi:hypothetical protein